MSTLKTYRRTPVAERTHNLRVGARVRLQRLNHGQRQQDVARRAGLSRCRLSAIENGDVPATGDELQRLARAVGVPAAAFVSRVKSQREMF